MKAIKKDRKLCNSCHIRPAAINYIRMNQTYYRAQCDICARKKKPATDAWRQAGYKKKSKCERCGFDAKVGEQLAVICADKNPNNVVFTNLKTVCLNCKAEIDKKNLRWIWGGLTPDF